MITAAVARFVLRAGEDVIHSHFCVCSSAHSAHRMVAPEDVEDVFLGQDFIAYWAGVRCGCGVCGCGCGCVARGTCVRACRLRRHNCVFRLLKRSLDDGVDDGIHVACTWISPVALEKLLVCHFSGVLPILVGDGHREFCGHALPFQRRHNFGRDYGRKSLDFFLFFSFEVFARHG